MDLASKSNLEAIEMKEKLIKFKSGKKAWEKVVDTYDGPDKLKFWSQYMFWYHKNQKYDTEKEYSEILRKCLQIFEYHKDLINDARLIRMWINYIGMHKNPLHFFNVLFLRGAGRKSALFYTKWAQCYEVDKLHKQVEAVFRLAFQERAEPVLIRIAYQNYKKRQPKKIENLRICQSQLTLPGQHQYKSQLNFQDQDNKAQDQVKKGQKELTQGGCVLNVTDQQLVTQRHESDDQIGLKRCRLEMVTATSKENRPPLLLLVTKGQQELPHGESLHQIQYPEKQFPKSIVLKGNQCNNSVLNVTNQHLVTQLHQGTGQRRLKRNRIEMVTFYKLQPDEIVDFRICQPQIPLPEQHQGANQSKDQLKFQGQGTMNQDQDQVKNAQQEWAQGGSVHQTQYPEKYFKKPIVPKETQFKNSDLNASDQQRHQFNDQRELKRSRLEMVAGNTSKENRPPLLLQKANQTFCKLPPDEIVDFRTSQPQQSLPGQDQKVNQYKLNFQGQDNKAQHQATKGQQELAQGGSLHHPQHPEKHFPQPNVLKENQCKDSEDLSGQQLKARCDKPNAQGGHTLWWLEMVILKKTAKPYKSASYKAHLNKFVNESLCAIPRYQEMLKTEHANNRMECSLPTENLFPLSRTAAVKIIDSQLGKKFLNPFDKKLRFSFLAIAGFPKADNCKLTKTLIPNITKGGKVDLPAGGFIILQTQIGRGSYGMVYKAKQIPGNKLVAVKYSAKPQQWEIHICEVIRERITDPSVLCSLMEVKSAIIAPNGSLIVSELGSFGSLFYIAEKYSRETGKPFHELVVMHFAKQICSIVHYLHINDIIHADIKPDNFLLMCLPCVTPCKPSVRLIDFGCAIDMRNFPGAVARFNALKPTQGFTCIEMKEQRPWAYETDVYCIAATIHYFLFGEFMEVEPHGGIWKISHKYRWHHRQVVWDKFFNQFLNLKAENLPNLLEVSNAFKMQEMLMKPLLQKHIRVFNNFLQGK